MKPILKWVGGKSQLLPEIRKVMPEFSGRYFEPFFGGGAVFFDIERPGSVISDFNPRLVNFYQHLRENPDGLFTAIVRLGEEFDALDSEEKKLHYYAKRDQFNTEAPDSEVNASLFYYLNKTGFNGLFRENALGNFNVPFGQKKSFSYPEQAHLAAATELLRQCKISHSSFDTSIIGAKKGDLVYFDPPYVPLEGSPSFTAYLSSGFGPEKQELLANIVKDLTERGVLVIASNSYTKSVRELYTEFNVTPIKARRNINSDGAGRGTIDEALITNFR